MSAPLSDESSVKVEGTVVEGDHRGRALGFPTANLAPDREVALPEDGVYAGHVYRADGTQYVSAISIGNRSTYYDDGATRILEAHLLDFDGDLYGEHITVVVEELIRKQLAFQSSEELIAQISSDVAQVRLLKETRSGQ